MWPTPSDPVQLDGLGGGIAWAEDASLCASLLKRFDAETLEYFGMRIFSFVSCEEITDSLLRAFSTWSANHGRINFFLLNCSASSPTSACSDAEVILTADATSHGEPLEVSIETALSSDDDAASGDAATSGERISRVTLTFDTSSQTCYYMDSTVCETVRALGAAIVVPKLLGTYDIQALVGLSDLALAYALARGLTYLPALLGLLYFVWNVALLTVRSHRAGCDHFVYVLASLSHRWRLVTLLFAVPPLLDWKMLMPCEQVPVDATSMDT